ncbi:unnamed protein product [Urochloa decumbens]|uniref:Uncharacterized protein n=1 Tax=Urochloa decumbens TaxID=240449 RepID=A0ABC9C2V4_9POAL
MEAEIAKPVAASVSMLSSGSAGPASAGGEFTADDLAAADQLMQLSVSGGGDDDEVDGQHEAFSSSSARSVNNAKAAAAARGEDEEDEEEDSGEVDRRTKKRYRLLTELYAATRPVRAGGKSKRKSSRDGMRK